MLAHDCRTSGASPRSCQVREWDVRSPSPQTRRYGCIKSHDLAVEGGGARESGAVKLMVYLRQPPLHLSQVICNKATDRPRLRRGHVGSIKTLHTVVMVLCNSAVLPNASPSIQNQTNTACGAFFVGERRADAANNCVPPPGPTPLVSVRSTNDFPRAVPRVLPRFRLSLL
jgi:hypothetical protein